MKPTRQPYWMFQQAVEVCTKVCLIQTSSNQEIKEFLYFMALNWSLYFHTFDELNLQISITAKLADAVLTTEMIVEITTLHEILHHHFLHCDSCLCFMQFHLSLFRTPKYRKLTSIELYYDISLILVRPIWR